MNQKQDHEKQYPSNWPFVPLGELNSKHATTINPKRFSSEQFEYYSIPAYQDGEVPLLAFGQEIESAKLLLEAGTILFGKLNPRVEKVWRVGNYFNCRKIGSTEWIPVCPKQEINGLFLYYLFWSEHVMPKAKTLVSGSTPSRQRVDPRAFYRIKVPVPPLSEQERIAYVLSMVQTAIEQQERLIKLTRELKSALMQKLFTEGLRGEKQKMTEIGLVPESWDVLPLDTCATIQTGTAKGREIADDESLELPYLRVANVQDGYLDLAEIKTIKIRANEKERYLLRKGDVVLTEGGDFDKLGRGFIWQGQIENCIHQNHIFAVRVNLDKLLPAFFAYQSQSPYGKKYFLSVAHKTSNLACINTAKLKRFPVLVPKLKEQEQITDILQTIEKKLRIQARRRNLLEELFRTLLHQLMTGQTRVHDIDLPGFAQEIQC